MSRARWILLGLVVFGLVVSPAMALCVRAESPCCCGTPSKPGSPCPVQCAFESPDSSPQTTPEAVRLISPLFVVVAEVDPILLPSSEGAAIAVSDDFPESSLLSKADPTRAPPFSA